MEEILYLLNPWWSGNWQEKSISREKYTKQIISHFKDRLAGVVVGSRRVGKTIILHQVIKELLDQGVNSAHIIYVLLDHPRFSNLTISQIITEYRRLHDLTRNTKIFIFLDEIQHNKTWEQEVKAMIDTEEVKVFVSGSSSTLILQKQTFLTGRYFKLVVEPLSFKEFLEFKKVKISQIEKYRYQKYFKDYLNTGGYPEYALSQNPQYFTDLVEAVIFNDIVSLYGVRNPQLVRDLLLLLSDRCGHQTSFTKLGKILSLTTDTVREYVEYLQQTFILGELRRFASSRNKQVYAAKKFYLNDNGLLFNLTGKLNLGSASEQVLFNYLRRTDNKIFFYYENQTEVDFVIDTRDGLELIESKYDLDQDKQKLEGRLLTIAKNINASKIKIITKEIEDKTEADNISIVYIPFWKFVLN